MFTKTLTKLPQTGGKWHLPYPTGEFSVIGYHDIMTGKSKEDGVLIRLLYPAKDQSVNMATTQAQWPNWYPHENYKSELASAVSEILLTVNSN